MSDEQVERFAESTLTRRALIRRAAAAGLAATAAATYAQVLGADSSAFGLKTGGANGNGVRGGRGGVHLPATGGRGGSGAIGGEGGGATGLPAGAGSGTTGGQGGVRP